MYQKGAVQWPIFRGLGQPIVLPSRFLLDESNDVQHEKTSTIYPSF